MVQKRELRNIGWQHNNASNVKAFPFRDYIEYATKIKQTFDAMLNGSLLLSLWKLSETGKISV